MGGVDLCNRCMSNYSAATRTRKWSDGLFNHVSDLVCINRCTGDDFKLIM